MDEAGGERCGISLAQARVDSSLVQEEGWMGG